MEHPFFDKRRIYIPYFIVWILIACIHAVLLNRLGVYSLRVAVADSVVFNLVFIILSLLLWYPVRAIYANIAGITMLFVSWLLLILAVEMIWLSSAYSLMILLFKDPAIYAEVFPGTFVWRLLTGLFLSVIILMVYYLILSAEELQDKKMREAELRTLVADTEMQNLKNQLNPHFLFNTLNTMGNLILKEPERAHGMVIKLAGYLRWVLAYEKQDFILLKDELEQTRLYLELEKIRFEERWNVNEKIEENCDKHRIPVMILQPLFENAIRYSFYENAEDGALWFACREKNGNIEIILKNTFDPGAVSQDRQGIGLYNIRKRLTLLYGRDDLLHITRKGNIFEVHLMLPPVSGEAGE